MTEFKDVEDALIERMGLGGCGWEIKTDGDEKGTVVGYASTFGNVDQGKDRVNEKAFDDTIAEHTKNGTMPHMFFNHNSNEPCGDWQDMKVDGRGLKMKGKLWIGQGIPKADQAYNMLRSKTGKGFSIGYITRDSKRDEKTGVRDLLKVDLHEVSPTPNPMNRKATVSSVKSLLDPNSIITVRDAEDILRDAGMSSTEAKALLAKLRSAFDTLRDAESKSKQEALLNIKGEVSNLIKALNG